MLLILNNNMVNLLFHLIDYVCRLNLFLKKNNSAHRFRSKWRFSGWTEWKRCWVRDGRLQSGLSFLFSWSDSPVPNSVHPGADRPSGEGVLPGELRVQAAEVRTGGSFKSTWDYNQGRPRMSPWNRNWPGLQLVQICIICVRRHVKPRVLQNREHCKGNQFTPLQKRKTTQAWPADYYFYYYSL